MWAEVKPFAFTPEELNKAYELHEATEKAVLLLVGPPDNRPYEATMLFADGTRERMAYMLTGECLDENRFYSSLAEDETRDDTERACRVARSARFEFGESGAG